MASNKNLSSSRLLTIPVEIRLKILTFTLAYPDAACIRVERGSPADRSRQIAGRPDFVPANSDQRSAQILRVCRQLYNEGVPILYDTVQFHFFSLWIDWGKYMGEPIESTIGQDTLKFVPCLVAPQFKAGLDFWTTSSLLDKLPNVQHVKFQMKVEVPGTTTFKNVEEVELHQLVLEGLQPDRLLIRRLEALRQRKITASIEIAVYKKTRWAFFQRLPFCRLFAKVDVRRGETIRCPEQLEELDQVGMTQDGRPEAVLLAKGWEDDCNDMLLYLCFYQHDNTQRPQPKDGEYD